MRRLADHLGRAAGPATYALAGAVGLAALAYPLWAPSPAAGAGLAPLALALLVALCLAALGLEAASSGLGARRVAALGVLVAITSALRFVETLVPGPGGFSPVFFPIIVSGYVFGPRFGFLLGTMALAVSAVVTGGVGPWLPAQMLVAGWVGLTAGWLPGGGAGGPAPSRARLAALVGFGAAWGMLYGLLMTPWSWLFYDGGLARDALPGTVLVRFLAFYLATSAAWDAFRALGNALLLAAAGPAVIWALRRLGRWFAFAQLPVSHPWPAPVTPAPVDGPRPGALLTRRGPRPSRAPRQSGRTLAETTALPASAWVTWVAAVAVLASSSRNPVLLLLLLLTVLVVRAALPVAAAPHALSPSRVAVVFVPVSALYGLLSLRAGAHELVRLPAGWWLASGPLTLEGLVFGASTGLALVTLFAAFSTFERALGTRGLVRLVPRAFAALGLAAAIALTHLPLVRRQASAVGEAFAVRGGPRAGPRAWRAWRTLAVPLLVGGLERSAQLAESLALRGLAPEGHAPTWWRAVTALGLGLVAAGWMGAVTGRLSVWPAAGLALAGACLVAAVAVGVTRRSPRTDLRRHEWSAAAALAAAAPLLPLAALATPAGRLSAAWSPFPALTAPALDPLLTVSLALLLAPAVLRAPGAAAAVSAAAQAPPSRCRAPRAPVKQRPPLPAAAGSRARRRPAVRARALTYRYPDAARAVLTDLTFTLGRGTVTVIAGPSGAGKSTLLRAMAGLVPHFSGGSLAGRLHVAGADPTAVGPDGMAGRVGFVPGDPETSFVMEMVADEVAFPLEQRGVPADDVARRVTAALADVGLESCRKRAIASLSGGERQRVAIAAALTLGPPVLLLDEPTSQLDDATAREVLDVVEDLARRKGVAVVISEHRLERVLGRADTVLRLGAPRSRPAPAARTARPPGDLPSARAAPRLELSNVSFGHDGRPLLRRANLRVAAGEVVALTGPSGCGKTTLLRLSLGLLRPTSGQVRVGGREPEAGRRDAPFCHVAYLPQDPSTLLLADSVAAELDLTLRNHGLPANGAVNAVLRPLGLAELASCYPRDLSSGQRLRVALAAVTVTEPPLWILDEPTRGLDDDAVEALAAFLRSGAGRGAGVLLASHDHRLVARADRVLRLRDGRLVPLAPRRA